jgi:tagatose 1,6-diphosphate aldolase
LSAVAEDCIKFDIPFLVEPKTYRLDGEKMDSVEFARRLPEMVIETARQITALPVDVLKAEFPADVKYEKDTLRLSGYCRQLDAASESPWVILSAGVDYDTFKQQVKLACEAGASGFLGGRAIWQEALDFTDTADRYKYFQDVAAVRLQELGSIAGQHARSWHDKWGLSPDRLADINGEWYKRY